MITFNETLTKAKEKVASLTEDYKELQGIFQKKQQELFSAQQALLFLQNLENENKGENVDYEAVMDMEKDNVE